ncbi:hypothetical protein Q8F55_003982 [Vanrija albida]|uniref:Zn(2)-C6 fungal-type domain-containing protein n=1 Tax=Vanrija albida TaxID=181172 RepID=A0ABR3Q620_9TREE
MEDALTTQQQQDNDAVAAAAAAAAAASLGLADLQPPQQHHFHHNLQQPDFSHTHKDDGTPHDEVDVHALEIPVDGEDDVGLHDHDLDLSLSLAGTPHAVDTTPRASYGRPPSIRKACDLCHAAKQKCSGDRPACSRCAQGGWQCIYAPRQRRRTVPKDQKLAGLDGRSHGLGGLGSLGKKRKLQRDSMTLGTDGLDMRMAMGMAMDLGLAEEEEDEHLLTMSDDQMLESIAIDGYLADLPLGTFVNNLPYNSAPPASANAFGADDFPGAGDAYNSSEMDQHTTSALRDAIFSLNESSGAGQGHDQTGAEGQVDGTDQQGIESIDQQGLDPHLALLDLSHAMPVEEGPQPDPTADLNLTNIPSPQYPAQCQHIALVPRILALLTQHPLEPKPGSNTPLSMYIFAPLARSLRLFLSIIHCQHCSGSPQQTLPQLALLSRTTTILTYPFPPLPPNAAGQPSAQITIHGARLSGTGISEAIEQHIVGVAWDSWRASIREIFNSFERKAQDVIQQNAALNATNDGGQPPSSAETQRAGLMFQAMTRLVSAMNEVERD